MVGEMWNTGSGGTVRGEIGIRFEDSEVWREMGIEARKIVGHRVDNQYSNNIPFLLLSHFVS